MEVHEHQKASTPLPVASASGHVEPGITMLSTSQNRESLSAAGKSTKATLAGVLSFLELCESYLGPISEQHEPALIKWHDDHIPSLENPEISAFMAEFANSLSGTPGGGRQRRSSVTNNSDFEKLLSFLNRLYQKHSGSWN